MWLKNYIFVVFKVYLSASIVSAMDILEFLNTLKIHFRTISLSVLPLYSQRLLPKFGHEYFNHI